MHRLRAIERSHVRGEESARRRHVGYCAHLARVRAHRELGDVARDHRRRGAAIAGHRARLRDPFPSVVRALRREPRRSHRDEYAREREEREAPRRDEERVAASRRRAGRAYQRHLRAATALGVVGCRSNGVTRTDDDVCDEGLTLVWDRRNGRSRSYGLATRSKLRVDANHALVIAAWRPQGERRRRRLVARIAARLAFAQSVHYVTWP